MLDNNHYKKLSSKGFATFLNLLCNHNLFLHQCLNIKAGLEFMLEKWRNMHKIFSALLMSTNGRAEC